MGDPIPKISVIIPCYNHGAYLAETLNSVQEQTFTDYEIIVVNDGSTDPATVALLQTICQPKTKVINTINRGVSAARNRGIAEAKGEFILPLDADDLIAPTYLEKGIALLDAHPDLAVVYCERVMFGDRNGVESLPGYELKALLVNNLIYPAAMFRKADWANVGGYSEKMCYGWEDWDFWISLSELKKGVVKLHDELFFYRVRSASRDHSLTFVQKLAMLLIIMTRHKYLYMKHVFYVVSQLCYMHILKPCRQKVMRRKKLQD